MVQFHPNPLINEAQPSTRSEGNSWCATPASRRATPLLTTGKGTGLHYRCGVNVWTSGRARRRRQAHEVFETFRNLPGSRAMASEFALTGLIRELERTRPTAILELGPGIGTTTHVLATLDPVPATSVWCVEENEWCRQQLAINLAEEGARVQVVNSVAQLPPDAGPFDFVLVDGPGDPSWADRLAPRAAVYVENHRQDQRDALSARTGRPHVTRSRWPLASLGRLAGYHVIQFEPTALERAVFTVGGGFNLAVDRLRMINRRILGRMGLERVLQWDERRAYRNRLEPVAEDVEYNRQRRQEH